MKAIVAILLCACAAEPGDDMMFPDPAQPDAPIVEPTCGSPLGKAVLEGTRTVVPRGSVPAEYFVTEHNTADATPLLDGPQIFPAFRALIASARHHVSLQTYVWEPDTDPTTEILAGLRDLAARRAVEAPAGPPVTVRFLFDVSTIGFGSNASALPAAWAAVESLALDPKLVTFELASFQHLALGNLHVKTLVVDGRAAIVTGANPQAHHDYAAPWRDAGFRFAGDIAIGLLADFDNAWKQSFQWTCGSRSDLGIEACSQPTAPIAWTIDHAQLADTTCMPMIVATRAADANPLSNRIDNPQDQALLAAFGAAKSRIRIHTPNLNDDAAKAALVAAIQRGVEVDVVLSKGFNDTTEIAPGQGGTNDENVAALYAELAAAGVAEPCKKLQIRWYSRDRLQPIVGNGLYASHEKYTSIDDTLVIVGTANMDTQSWNNSREVNVAVDDAAITKAWDDALFVPDFEHGILVDQCPTPVF